MHVNEKKNENKLPLDTVRGARPKLRNIESSWQLIGGEMYNQSDARHLFICFYAYADSLNA